MQILRKREASQKTGLSMAHIDRITRDPNNDFPAKVQLGGNAVGWYEHEIDEWLSNRPRGPLPITR